MNTLHWRDLLSRRYDTREQALMTAWVSQRLGSVAAALAFRAGMSPNAVTLLGLLVMLAACPLFVLGTGSSAWLSAAVLWQLGFALDCADGQLARATGRSGPYGAWLDVTCDHVRQSSIVLSVLCVLQAAAMPGLQSFGAVFIMLSGMTVYLHTATMMKVDKPPPINVGSRANIIREIVKNLLDTPVFLLLLCILRPVPALLALFVFGYGLLLIVRGVAIANLRLR